jgi:hypothetical protein
MKTGRIVEIPDLAAPVGLGGDHRSFPGKNREHGAVPGGVRGY